MATSMFSCSSSCALLLVLLVAVTPFPGASQELPLIADTVTECYPPTNFTNSTAFRKNVLELLAKLPSAASPTGFATLRSGGRFNRAFVRGLCFDDAAPADSARCLSVAATTINSSCGADRHRAGVWIDGCFISYADANTTTPDEDAQHPRVITGGPADALARSASGKDLQWLAANAQLLAPLAALNDYNMLATVNATALAWDYGTRSTVRVMAQCARDRTAADCNRCLEYSARVAGSCCWGLNPWRDGVAAAVLGFNCYLRFEVSSVPVPLRRRIEMLIRDYPFSTAMLTALVVGLVVSGLAEIIKEIYKCCMKRKIDNARNPSAVSTATAERAFSSLKIIKTRPRNKMEDDNLANNMLVHIEGGILEEYRYDDVISDFKSIKDRAADL